MATTKNKTIKRNHIKEMKTNGTFRQVARQFSGPLKAIGCSKRGIEGTVRQGGTR
jgi:hypothetical protein